MNKLLKKINLYFLILVIILIIIILYYNKTQSNYINYKKDTIYKNDVTFTKTNNICNILYLEDYFKNFNEYDIKARNIVLDSKNTNIVRYYCNQLLNFTTFEKKCVKLYLEDIRKNGTDSFICNLINKKWNFAKFKNFVENGYPHTHRRVIFLSQDYIDKICKYISRGKIEHGIGRILVHEKIHILQRLYPEIFDELYRKYWNFERVDKIQNLELLEPIIRNNPDVDNNSYLFKLSKEEYLLPTCIYNINKKVENLEDVLYIGVYVKKERGSNGIIYKIDREPRYELLNKIEKYANYFNLNNNNYHANELSAELMSQWYYKDYSNKSEGAKQLKLWCNYLENKIDYK